MCPMGGLQVLVRLAEVDAGFRPLEDQHDQSLLHKCNLQHLCKNCAPGKKGTSPVLCEDQECMEPSSTPQPWFCELILTGERGRQRQNENLHSLFGPGILCTYEVRIKCPSKKKDPCPCLSLVQVFTQLKAFGVFVTVGLVDPFSSGLSVPVESWATHGPGTKHG